MRKVPAEVAERLALELAATAARVRREPACVAAVRAEQRLRRLERAAASSEEQREQARAEHALAQAFALECSEQQLAAKGEALLRWFALWFRAEGE